MAWKSPVPSGLEVWTGVVEAQQVARHGAAPEPFRVAAATGLREEVPVALNLGPGPGPMACFNGHRAFQDLEMALKCLEIADFGPISLVS